LFLILTIPLALRKETAYPVLFLGKRYRFLSGFRADIAGELIMIDGNDLNTARREFKGDKDPSRF